MGMQRTNRAWLATFALAAIFMSFFTSVSSAQLPAARLTSIFPPGGRAGTDIEVTAAGVDLDDAGELRFSAPGIRAKLLDSSDSQTERKFLVIIPPDVPPGNYQMRVAGRFGITNPRGFVVGDLPEGIAGSASPGPIPLPLDTVVNGRGVANAAQEFAVQLRQGQRIIITCCVREIDSRMLPVMVLSDAAKTELTQARHGDMIDFTAPADATYTLSLHDLLYKGGPEYFYRLSASTAPRIDAIFPPLGVPGSNTKYTLLGRNLPGGSPTSLRAADGKLLEQVQTDIEFPANPSLAMTSDSYSLLGPAGAGIDAISYRLKTPNGVSNPVLIAESRAPVAMCAPDNHSPDKAQRLTIPCEVAGRFYPHGSRDFYTVEAEKGGVYWIEIISSRLGQHTSPELLVQLIGKNDKGVEKLSDVQELGGPDMQPMGKRGGGASAAFPAPSRDLEYRLESKEGGVYRLTVRDLFDETNDNAALSYCMVIHKQAPDFHLVATTAPLPSKDGNDVRDPNVVPCFLRKGGAAPIRVNVLRQDGFDDEVRVEVRGLPPGVRCNPAVVPAGENMTNLVLMADEKAEGWVGDIRIIGTAKIADADVSHDARIGAVTWQALNANGGSAERIQSRLCTDMPLAVSADEAEPLTFEIVADVLEGKADAKVHLSVKLNRRVEMKQPLKIQVAGLPRGNNNKIEATLVPDADTADFDIDLAQQRLTPGTYTLYVQAAATIKYERAGALNKNEPIGKKRPANDALSSFYSPPITLKVLPK